MAEEFRKFPEQYKTNIDFLKQQNDPFKSGVEFLEKEYNDKNTMPNSTFLRGGAKFCSYRKFISRINIVV